MGFIGGHQRELNAVRRKDMQRLGGTVHDLHALRIDDLTEWAPGSHTLTTYAEERWRAHLASRLPAIRHPLPVALQRRLRSAADLVSDAMEDLAELAGRSED
jgi:hypothetical protein